MRFLSIRGGASQPFRRRPQALKHLRGGVAVVVCGPDRYDGILLLYLDKKTLSCGRAAAVVPRFNILLLSECQKAEYSDRVPYATRAAAAEAERLHTSLLLEEKETSAARRMRWSSVGGSQHLIRPASPPTFPSKGRHYLHPVASLTARAFSFEERCRTR